MKYFKMSGDVGDFGARSNCMLVCAKRFTKKTLWERMKNFKNSAEFCQKSNIDVVHAKRFSERKTLSDTMKNFKMASNVGDSG
jgi:hypothetical protein